MTDETNDPLLGIAISRLYKVMEYGLTEFELSPAQYRMLAQLGEAAEPSTTLAKKLEVSASSVTTVVDGLVRRGAVERVPSEEDRRSVPIRVTDTGRVLLAASEGRIRGLLGECAAELGDGTLAANIGSALALWGDAIGLARVRRAALSLKDREAVSS